MSLMILVRIFNIKGIFITDGLEWKTIKSGSPWPARHVKTGPVVVARIRYYNGAILPGKYQSNGYFYTVRGDGMAELGWRGDVEVLLYPSSGATSFVWVPVHDRQLPGGALVGGVTIRGQSLYIARAGDKLLSGYFNPNKTCADIEDYGPHCYTQFEVLKEVPGKWLMFQFILLKKSISFHS